MLLIHNVYNDGTLIKSGGGRVVQLCWVNALPGRPINLDYSMMRPTALAVGPGGVVWTFSLVYHCLFFLPLSGRQPDIGLKYCLKGPLSPKHSIHQPTQYKVDCWRYLKNLFLFMINYKKKKLDFFIKTY